MNFKVIHRGIFDHALSEETIKQNLSELLDLSIDEITIHFFSKKHYTLIGNLNEAEANEYVNAVHEAGALVVKELDIDVNEFFEKTEPDITQQHKHQSTYSTEYEKKGSTKEITLQELEEETQTNRRRREDEEATSKIRQFDDISVIEPLLLSPSSRIGRVRFIARIFVLLSLVLFVNNILNIRLYDWLGSGSIAISLAILVGLGLCFLIIITQRLSDLDKPMTFTMIVLLPIVLASFSAFSIRLDTIRYEQMKFGQEMGAGLYSGSNKIKSEDMLLLKERIDLLQDKEKSFQEYKALYILSYAALFALIASLLVLPGTRKNNVYGAPPKQIGLLSFISITTAAFVLLVSFLAPFMMKNYELRKIQYDTAFFETIGVGQSLPFELQQLYKEYLGDKTK